MLNHPLLSFPALPLLALTVTILAPAAFGQFEIIPNEEVEKTENLAESDLDPFGASPDEFEAGDKSSGAEDATKRAAQPAKTQPAKTAPVKPEAADPIPRESTSGKSRTGNQSGSGKTAPAKSAVLPPPGKTAPITKRPPPRKKSTATKKPFEEQFWQYLKANNYSNWAPVPGTSGNFYDGQSPHGALLKIYINRTAVANTDQLPEGSVIVKENYDENKKLSAITVMYRAQGYNLKTGNWYWVKYNPDGTVYRTSTAAGFKKICGSVKSCIDCHVDAGGGDFAFFNDDL